MQKLTEEEFQYYERQLTLPSFTPEMQKRLKNSSLLIVGLGGLGSAALPYLAGAGAGTISLMDGDWVSKSNLHRQLLYTVDDTGKEKVRCAAEFARKRNPHIIIREIPQFLDTDNAAEIIAAHDFVLDGSDNMETRYLLDEVCGAHQIPFVYAGVYAFEGQLAVFHNGGKTTFRDLFPTPPSPAEIPTCDENGILGFVPGTMGILQAQQAIFGLLDSEQQLVDKLLILDFESMHTKTFAISPKSADTASYSPSNSGGLDACEIGWGEVNLYKAKGYKIIDVRSEKEYASHNIGGQNVPMPEIHKFIADCTPDKGVIFLCQKGIRSLIALELLQDAGHEKAVHVKGGLARKPRD